MSQQIYDIPIDRNESISLWYDMYSRLILVCTCSLAAMTHNVFAQFI